MEKGVVFEVAPTPAGRGVGARRRVSGRVRQPGDGRCSARPARAGPATLMLDHGWEAELLRFPLDVGARITSSAGGAFGRGSTVAASLTITGIMGSELVQTESRVARSTSERSRWAARRCG